MVQLSLRSSYFVYLCAAEHFLYLLLRACMKKVPECIYCLASSASRLALTTNYPVTWKVELYFANLVETQGMTLAEFCGQGISPLDYNAFIFAGRQAVEHFFRLIREMRLEVSPESRFLCIGEAVAQHLFQYIPGSMRRRT